MQKKIIRINKDEIPMLAEMTRMPAEKLNKYAYMFEPGFEQRNIKFWGFVPDEEFLKYVADTIENLGIDGPLDITLADAEHYAKLLGGGKTVIEDAIEKGQYIGSKEDAEKFKKHFRQYKEESLSKTLDAFNPGFRFEDGRARLAVNIDADGTKDGLVEGLLHFLTEKNGYLKTAISAHKRAEEAFLSTNVEQEILESTREGIGNLLAYAVGVDKGYVDFVKKTVTDFLDKTYKDNIEAGSYNNLNDLQMGSLMYFIDISSHTLPQNFHDRNRVKKAEIDARIEKIAQHLHPNVKKYVPQIQSAFYDFQIPPTEKSVFDCYRKVFETYFALPESEMEWNKKLGDLHGNNIF